MKDYEPRKPSFAQRRAENAQSRERNVKKTIEKEVERSLQRGDYTDLSKQILKTVDIALDQALHGARKFLRWGSEWAGTLRSPKVTLPARDPALCDQKIPTSPWVIPSIILGVITGISSVVLFNLVVTHRDLPTFLLFFGFFVLCLLGTFYSIQRTKRENDRKLRYLRYLREFGDRTLITITDLTHAVQLGRDVVLQDLKYFMKKNHFKEAHLLDDEIFTLDLSTYHHYMALPRDSMKEDGSEETVSEAPLSEETSHGLEEGLQKLSYLKTLAEEIQNEKVCHELAALEEVIEKILLRAQKEPAKCEALRRFMDYYLPTTVKLSENYRDFESQSARGEDVEEAMEEISQALSTISTAFQKLLDGLFEDDRLEVRSDIEVLKTLLNQEGLIGEDFPQRKE